MGCWVIALVLGVCVGAGLMLGLFMYVKASGVPHDERA